MDIEKRKRLSRLLGELGTKHEADRAIERSRAIREASLAYRFQDLKRDVLLPAFREFMLELEKRGHQTRMRERGANRVRLDVQIQATPATRGAIELTLLQSGEGRVQIEYGWGWETLHHEVIELDHLDRAVTTERLLGFLADLNDSV